MSWPVNHYLDAWLRTGEGQAYLEKHGCLENWKQRHLLDPVMGMEVVIDPTMAPNSFSLVSEQGSMTVTNVTTVTAPAPVADEWSF